MAEWFQLERDSVMLSGICGSPDRSVELCAGSQVQLCTVGGGLCLHWNAKAAHTATSLQWGHCAMARPSPSSSSERRIVAQRSGNYFLGVGCYSVL